VIGPAKLRGPAAAPSGPAAAPRGPAAADARAPRRGPLALLGHSSLPADLLQDAARRLSVCALICSLTWGVAFALPLLARRAGVAKAIMTPLQHWIPPIWIALSAPMFPLARSQRLPPARLLDLGLVFMIVNALGVALYINCQTSIDPHGTVIFYGLSYTAFSVLLYALIVPSPPLKMLVATLIAVSMDFVVVGINRLRGQQTPTGTELFFRFAWSYVAALIAVVPSQIVSRLSSEVKAARELGAYQLLELLGRGGMGEVWRARHRMLARPAAIKLVRPEVLGSTPGLPAQALLRRFEREAQATAALHSPHTIELFDFGIDDEGTFYYVMEFLDGMDLETLVARFGPLPAERVVHLLAQACHSLADAHHAGLVHRDIKPANLYVCRMGLDVDFVKVLDFGLVKWDADAHAEQTRVTMEGATSGTPAYMPPEAITGDAPVDGRLDLYALGCVAYWLLTGTLVFEADTPMKMLLAHVQRQPAPPSQRTELPVPPALEEIVLACLQKDPGKRPASALALREMLLACALPERWTPQRAQQWWELHQPVTA
jgi:tRNA A-37 threonylcarbamoyl transferase component Bud32